MSVDEEAEVLSRIVCYSSQCASQPLCLVQELPWKATCKIQLKRKYYLIEQSHELQLAK